MDKPLLKLQPENTPGTNTTEMVGSISAKIGKGPIPEQSDSILVHLIHQVPVQSTIGKAMEDLGNVSYNGGVMDNPGNPDRDSSSSDLDSSGLSSSTNKSKLKGK